MQSHIRMCACVSQHESSFRLKTANASIMFHPHIVWANWSLSLNNKARSGSAFAAQFCNIAGFLCAYMYRMSAALSSAVPQMVWWRARRLTRNNGAINSHLCFLQWPCHRRLWGSEVRRAKCEQHSATRCTSSHSADLKSVASIWEKEEKILKHSPHPCLLYFCCNVLLSAGGSF